MMFSALNEAHIYIGKWLVKEKHHIFYNVPSIALKWDTSPSFWQTQGRGLDLYMPIAIDMNSDLAL